MLTLTIVMMNSGSVLDIMVKPEQRISEVLAVLAESGQILYEVAQQKIYARSWRLGRLVSDQLTFKQTLIQSGDILYIEVESI